MKKEEAIKIIRKELSCVDRDNCKREECKSCDLVMPSKEPIIEAYKMAIEALEKINRFQTAYNRVLSAKKVEDVEDLDGDELMIALAGILGCEPKTGHWIEGQINFQNIHNILCSCCFEGYPSKGHANSQYTKEKFKYCPNCDAKMKED